MIRKIDFKKPVSAQCRILNYNKIYAIDSMIEEGIVYGISNNKFAIIGYREAVYCDVKEMPKLIEEIVIEDIKKEIKSIYEDIKDIDLSFFN